MMATDVYVETSISAPQEKKRKWGYVLEAPGGRTVYQLGEMTGTMHGITLQVLIKALRRYQKPSRITIHAADEWVLQMLLRQLSAWEQNGFTNAKGEPIKYRSGWEQLANLIKIHTITIAPGRHAYSAWLQSEMEKMERGKQDV